MRGVKTIQNTLFTFFSLKKSLLYLSYSSPYLSNLRTKSSIKTAGELPPKSFKSIPEWIGGPIAEPALLLGLIFIFIVMFAPGGLSGAYYRLRMKALARKHS